MKLLNFINSKTIKVNFVSVFRLIRKLTKRKQHPDLFFGLLQDEHDERDYLFSLHVPSQYLPASTNRKNINSFFQRYNQGQIGSCVGHGICEAFIQTLKNNKMNEFEPSRLFAYYIARKDKDNDTGACIRDAFKAVRKYGLCSEFTWPYKESDFTVTPSEEAFVEALFHQSIKYERLPQTKNAIMEAIHSGFPIVYGKSVYESFMSLSVSKNGKIPVPNTKKEHNYGGHCMVIFDYDENGTIELNSWGNDWGQNGVCEVPWEYVLDSDLCRDFWVFYLIE